MTTRLLHPVNQPKLMPPPNGEINQLVMAMARVAQALRELEHARQELREAMKASEEA
jgi:hypothetical protein